MNSCFFTEINKSLFLVSEKKKKNENKKNIIQNTQKKKNLI